VFAHLVGSSQSSLTTDNAIVKKRRLRFEGPFLPSSSSELAALILSNC
jgi:hypothetical protein